MRHLTVSILVTLAVLLGSAGESFALPECPGTYNANTWTNCEGTFNFPDGNKYVGEWKDGNKHGQGTETTADGDKYVGEYKDGKINGQGTVTYGSGSKYVGEFKDGKRHGQGTYTFADGRVHEGVWERRQLAFFF